MPPAMTTESALGTIWAGEALVSYNKDRFRVIWDVSSMALLTGTLKAALEVDHLDANITAIVSADIFGNLAVKEVNGFIGHRLLNQHVIKRPAEMNGRIWLNDINLSLKLDKSVTAKGSAEWTGGAVRTRVGPAMSNLEVPPLTMNLSYTEDQAHAVVVDSDQKEWLQASLSPDGMSSLKIFQTAAESLGLDAGNSRSGVLMEVSQPLF